ncbi:MAG: TonB-dependent receptor [Halieaceae bacterium]
MNIHPLASLLLLSLASQTVLAREALPEIVVTAELRETTLLDSSISTTVVSADAIRDRAAQHLEEVLNLAPNVNYAGGTSRARYFQIRGIGDRSQFQEPLNPSVGFVLDGVDFSGIGSIGTLFDVDQVEVLRGPQGTLHGANALAGLINVTTAAPSDQPYKHIQASAGDYNSYGLGLVSSGPLTRNLLYRVAGEKYKSDGYQENDFLGGDDHNDRDELTLRGKLRWLASQQHSLDLGVTWIDIDNGYDAFSLDNTRTTLSDEPGKDQQQSLALSTQLYSSFDAFELQTRISYANTDADYAYDEDWTYVGFHPFGYSSRDSYSRERDSYSAEVRAVSNPAARLFKDSSDWVIGLYYLGNREDLDRRYTYAPRFNSSYDTDTYAVFAQLETTLTDSLTLISGLRFENRETDYGDNNDVNIDPDKNLWGGKLALEYQPGDSSLLYASLSRGYRANGINAAILANIDATDDPDIIAGLDSVREFDEETLLNYEIGLKRKLLDDSMQARLALFYMDRDDQQVRGSFLIPQPGGATSFVDYTSNAASGENYGAELEVDWLAAQGLRLWMNLGLLETEFKNYTNVFGEDLSGRDQAQAPQYQYSLGGHYSFASHFYLRLEVEGKDDFYFSDRHDAQADGYDLLHASIGYQAQHWSLSLWGRNLTDEDYYVRGFGSFGNDPRKDYITEPYYQFGEPRMVGVRASYTF